MPSRAQTRTSAVRLPFHGRKSVAVSAQVARTPGSATCIARILHAQCNEWKAFEATLTGTYTSIQVTSSLGASSTCVGPAANQLCNALRTQTPVSVSCGGITWNVDACGPNVELATGLTCNCGSSFAVRPCINNLNWGGFDGNTCGPPSQTLTVTCQ